MLLAFEGKLDNEWSQAKSHCSGEPTATQVSPVRHTTLRDISVAVLLVFRWQLSVVGDWLLYSSADLLLERTKLASECVK